MQGFDRLKTRRPKLVRLGAYALSLALHLGVLGLLVSSPAPSALIETTSLALDLLSSSYSTGIAAKPPRLNSKREEKRVVNDGDRILGNADQSRQADQALKAATALERQPEDVSPEEAAHSETAAEAGSGGSAPAKTAPAMAKASAEAQYLSQLRHRLESKKEFPIAARRLGHFGRVIVRFVLGRDGMVREAKIVEASRSDILNRAARSLIDQVGSLDPFPREIARDEWAVVVPIEYKF